MTPLYHQTGPPCYGLFPGDGIRPPKLLNYKKIALMKKIKDVFDRPGAGLRGERTEIPAFARICRHGRRSGPWQYSPAPGFRGVISQENNSRKYPVNLSKNPVNLSEFIEFYGNSLSPGEATGSAMIPAFSSSPVPANAGKCGGRPRPGRSIPIDGGGTGLLRDGEIPPHANPSEYSRAPRLPPPQLRANAGVNSDRGGVVE